MGSGREVEVRKEYLSDIVERVTRGQNSEEALGWTGEWRQFHQESFYLSMTRGGSKDGKSLKKNQKSRYVEEWYHVVWEVEDLERMVRSKLSPVEVK